MKRRWIPDNSSNAIPRRLVFLDCETKRTEIDGSTHDHSHNLRIGHASYVRLDGGKETRRKRKSFTTSEDFWSWFSERLDKKATTWLVAHNALFDWRVVDGPQLLEGGTHVLDMSGKKRRKHSDDAENPQASGFAVVEGPPTIIGMRDVTNDGRFVIVDSLNYFRCPLADMGDWIKVPKLEMPDWSESDKAWLTYCKRDVEILEKAMLKYIRWVESCNLGMFRYTIPSQAMAAFRHGRKPCRIYTDSPPEVKTLERASYISVPRQIYRWGEHHGRFWKVDVNSLFPSVMRANLFPADVKSWVSRSTWCPFAPSVPLEATIARVWLDSPEIPFQLMNEQGTHYVTGEFETVLVGPELTRAYDLGLIKQWGTYATYKTAHIFTGFVDEFFARRREHTERGEHFEARLCKTIANGLYGKFAQLSPGWHNVSTPVPSEPWITWRQCCLDSRTITNYRSFGWQTQILKERGEYFGSFPAISSFVTAYARERMRSLKETAGVDNVYFQSIDALIVTDQGLSNLENSGEISDKIGKFKIVGGSVDKVRIYTQGGYKFGDQVTYCGKPVNSPIDSNGRFEYKTFSQTANLFSPDGVQPIIESNGTKRITDRNVRGIIDDTNTWQPYDASHFAGSGSA